MAASANTSADHAAVGKADGLEGGEFGEALAHRLGDAVGGQEQHHEHAGQRDVAVHRGDDPCRCWLTSKAAFSVMDCSGVAELANMSSICCGDFGGLCWDR